MATYTGMREAIAEAPVAKAGDWEGVIDALYREHGYILSLLETLEEKAAQLERGKVPDYLLLRDMIDYLLHYPDQYHHPREDLLYAGLSRNDPAFRPKYDRLQREHRTLHEHNDVLFGELSRICEGRPADRQALLHALRQYISDYRQHIKFESKEIFPEARGNLTSAQLRKIEAKTRPREDPLFGNRARRQFQRLGRILQLRVSDLEQQVLYQEYSLLERVIEALSEMSASWRERPCADRLPKLPRLAGPPSWQARLMNGVMRVSMKPMMRFGSVDSMRGMTTRFDAQQERNLPKDVRWKKVRADGFEGEWIHIHPKRPRKVLLYFPGGGFIMRTAVQHKGLVARICRAANCKALMVHYRLAPETPFPGGLEDCLAAYHHLLEQGIAPGDITVAGDSAGGGLVLSTLLALRDERTPMPGGAIVLSPLGDLTYTGESRKSNKHRDPMLPTHRASAMHQVYIGNALPEDRYISPVLADFEGLPPILGQVGSTEILLDDTVRAADRAREAGVPFYLEIWEEMPHVFPMFGILPESKVAIERIAEFIQTGRLDPLPERYGRSEARR